MSIKISPYDYGKFQTFCEQCGAVTTKRYACVHNKKCKACFTSMSNKQPTRQLRLLDVGYTAYAREEGHFDDNS